MYDYTSIPPPHHSIYPFPLPSHTSQKQPPQCMYVYIGRATAGAGGGLRRRGRGPRRGVDAGGTGVSAVFVLGGPCEMIKFYLFSFVH